MRPKKINKKLSLNKKTIAHLANAEKRMIRGGVEDTVGCPLTFETECASCACTDPGYNTCNSCAVSCANFGTCEPFCGGGPTGGNEPITFSRIQELCY